MKLGVITDGISQDPGTACRALAEHGIEYAELQFVLGKEMILFGDQGAENWVVKNGAWQAQVRIMEIAVRMAERAGTDLVAETENGGMITSCFLGSRLIGELGSSRLGILWDPANSLYCTEEPFPTGYERGRRHIRHIHVKDVHVDIPRATVQFRALGTGDLAPYLVDIAAALRRDGYPGVVSLEANYQPPGGKPGYGFAASVEHFRRVFGAGP